MSEATILLAEDNEEINKANRRMLELNGYRVLCATSLQEARQLVAQQRPDLILLDIMMPDGSGLSFCQELRQNTPGVPILFLTALDKDDDVVAGLRAGGDDYLWKPYDYNVLLARIEALLRRARQAGQGQAVQTLGPFTFDPLSHRLYRGDADMLLKPKEYALIRLFAENPGVFFSPQALYRQVWAGHPGADVRTVYAHISSLRRKLGLYSPSPLLLEHRRGEGYRLLVSPRGG